jgi:hypothetical protein
LKLGFLRFTTADKTKVKDGEMAVLGRNTPFFAKSLAYKSKHSEHWFVENQSGEYKAYK